MHGFIQNNLEKKMGTVPNKMWNFNSYFNYQALEKKTFYKYSL